MKKNVDIKRQQKHARRMSSRLLCRPFSRYSTRSLSPHLSHHRRLTVLVSGRPLRCFSLSPVMVSRLPSLCLTCRLPLSHLSSPSINSNYKKKKKEQASKLRSYCKMTKNIFYRMALSSSQSPSIPI